MKIVITTGVFPPDLSGVANYVAVVGEKLAHHGHHVTVITTAEPQDLVINETWKYPFALFRINRREPKWKRFFQTIGIIKERGKEADILFANGLLLETRIANLFLRKPLVVRLASDPAWEKVRLTHPTVETIKEFNSFSLNYKKRLLQALRNFCLRGARKIIVSSTALATMCGLWNMKKEKIEVIPSISRQKKKFVKLNLPLETPFIFSTAGRLLPHKGFEELIKALTTASDVGLTVIGDGPSRGSLHQLAMHLGVADRVYFAGKKERGEAEDYIKSSDAFIAPATPQGFSLSALEALQARVIVALPKEILAEGVIEEGSYGVLFELKETPLLFEKLKEIISSPTLKETVLAGQKELLERFDTAQTITKVENVFREAIGVR